MIARRDASEGDDANSEPHGALVLHNSKLVVDLIELTLNHGLSVACRPRLTSLSRGREGYRPATARKDDGAIGITPR